MESPHNSQKQTCVCVQGLSWCVCCGEGEGSSSDVQQLYGGQTRGAAQHDHQRAQSDRPCRWLLCLCDWSPMTTDSSWVRDSV